MTRIRKVVVAVVAVFVVCLGLAGIATLLTANRPPSSVVPPSAGMAEIAPTPLASSQGSVDGGTAMELATATVEVQATNPPPHAVSITPEDDAVNVRSGPGTNYRVVATLANGTTAAVTGRTATGAWFQIEQGWVNAEVVLVTGDASAVPVVEID